MSRAKYNRRRRAQVGEASRSAAWGPGGRPEGPRSHRKNSEHEGRDELARVVAYGYPGCSRSRHLEKDSRIGPLLEPGETGHGQSYSSKQFPGPDYREQIHRVAEMRQVRYSTNTLMFVPQALRPAGADAEPPPEVDPTPADKTQVEAIPLAGLHRWNARRGAGPLRRGQICW